MASHSVSLKDFSLEELVLEILNRDISKLSEDLQCIILFQLGCDLHIKLKEESKEYVGHRQDKQSLVKNNKCNLPNNI